MFCMETLLARLSLVFLDEDTNGGKGTCATTTKESEDRAYGLSTPLCYRKGLTFHDDKILVFLTWVQCRHKEKESMRILNIPADCHYQLVIIFFVGTNTALEN